MSLRSESLKIEKDTNLSISDKLDEISALYSKAGYSVQSRSKNHLHMGRKKRFSFLWAFFGLLFFGFGLIIYLLYYALQKDALYFIRFADKSSMSAADEIKKLSDLLEKSVLTLDEFHIQKAKIVKSVEEK